MEGVGEHEVSEWRLPQNVRLQSAAQAAHLSPAKGEVLSVMIVDTTIKVASTSLHKHLVDAAPPHLKIQLEPLSRGEQVLNGGEQKMPF